MYMYVYVYRTKSRFWPGIQRKISQCKNNIKNICTRMCVCDSIQRGDPISKIIAIVYCTEENYYASDVERTHQVRVKLCRWYAVSKFWNLSPPLLHHDRRMGTAVKLYFSTQPQPYTLLEGCRISYLKEMCVLGFGGFSKIFLQGERRTMKDWTGLHTLHCTSLLDVLIKLLTIDYWLWGE